MHTMITGSPEYKAAVDKELDGLTERLYVLHSGCVEYVEWHAQQNPAVRNMLAEFPVAIEAAIGLLPLPAIVATVNFYFALHALLYQGWACRQEAGANIFGQIVTSTARWKM